MKALLVIDMQEEYVGENRNRKRFTYQSDILIPRINQRILEFDNAGNLVVYVINRFFYQTNKYIPRLVTELNIDSNEIFEKNRASCFSNHKLRQFLSDNNVTEIEMVGVDGNYCIAASALAARKSGLSVIVNHQCIGVANIGKLRKTLSRLEKAGVTIRE